MGKKKDLDGVSGPNLNVSDLQTIYASDTGNRILLAYLAGRSLDWLDHAFYTILCLGSRVIRGL